ncbi:MAG: hypothetical protein V4719_02420 [Planctomycetota bacterium]
MRRACLLPALLLMLATCFGQEVAKTPAPSADELKASLKKIRDSYAADFKGLKSPQSKWQLAEKLNKEAVEIKGDSEAKYALATEAIDLYLDAGDVLSAFRAVDELTSNFEINPITTKVPLFQKAAREAKAAPMKRLVALAGLKLAGDAAAAEDYEAAKNVVALSLQAAKPSRDASVIKRATEQQSRFNGLLKEWEQVVAAREKLKSDPDDVAANDINGRYLCFERQEWDKGLPLLVKGATPELKSVAALDMQTADEPASQSHTADAWWDVAESKKGFEKQQMIPRVAFWYEKALPGLNGLEKAAAEKRLNATYELMSSYNFKKITAEPANGVQTQGIVDCALRTRASEVGKTFDLRRSWLTSFEFSTPHFERGRQMLVYWGRSGQDPMWFRQDGVSLFCGIGDCASQRGQAMIIMLDPKLVNEWISVQFVHDTTAQELQLYINHRLVKKEAVAIVPQPGGTKHVVLGGTNLKHPPERFSGKIRNVWMGNIK